MSIAALLALGLAGCGPTPAPQASSSPAASTAPSTGATPTAPAASAAPATPPAPSATPRPPLIAPPGAEDVDETTPDGPVAAAPLPTASADLVEAIPLTTGMVIEIVSIDAIEVTAQTPGERDGSAVRVTVSARNDSTEPQSVDSAVVTLVAGEDLGIGTTAGRPTPLSGEVAPGDTVSGTYVFMLDAASDRQITVAVNYAAGEPVAVFTGTIS